MGRKGQRFAGARLLNCVACEVNETRTYALLLVGGLNEEGIDLGYVGIAIEVGYEHATDEVSVNLVKVEVFNIPFNGGDIPASEFVFLDGPAS